MGKASIVSALGDGKYLIKVKYNTTVSDRIIANCASRIAFLNALIDSLDILINAEEMKIIDLNLKTSPPATWQEYYAVRTRLNGYKRKRWATKIEAESHRQKMVQQQLLSRDVEVQAWCADLTKDLTGEVGTIEPNNIRADVPIIQPGYEDNAAYFAGRDGCLQHAVATDPAATYWNLAMFPGWQKWTPLYRTGSILVLDKTTNKATVSLNAAVSTQRPTGQDLDLNVEEILYDVPIRYMN